MNLKTSIIYGTNSKPVASAELAKFFSTHDDLEGQVLLGYPIIGTPEGPHAIDAIWISPQKGIVIFDLIENGKLDRYDLRQDDAANKLEARLKTYRDLMDKRKLLIDICTITFIPGSANLGRSVIDGYALANFESLKNIIDGISCNKPSEDIYNITLSAIQSISTIRRNATKRIVTKTDSRGAKLKKLEESIATLDNLQSKAVIETVAGVQRIRGLAGSGKTIVLALKAAYLHAQHPEWRIAVTFNTRSLKSQFRRLINNFSVEQTGDEPDWDNLRILNAWGAPGGEERDGFYHEFCHSYGVDYFDYGSAKNKFGDTRAFSGACEHAIEQVSEPKPLYDAVLVDEAQDLPPAFLRLCYKVLSDPKRLVYAYDELQNLSNESLPSPEELFGKKIDGSPLVQFENTNSGSSRQDIILSKCYRNSGPVLVTAHALGFGIYRGPLNKSDTGLVQMFDHPQLWEEIGYQRRNGILEEGSQVTLYRPAETSPTFLQDHSTTDDLIQFLHFENDELQAKWVIESIKRNIEIDELRHDDIVVINPEPTSTKARVGYIRSKLLEMGIQSHTAGVDTDPDIFFKAGASSITFTGVFRAKGNEAGMVYIINAQDCNSSAWNLATIRNRLFTAITRSKAWVRILGVGNGMQALIDEFEKVKRENFELKFTYPTKDQRDQLKVIHRDVPIEKGERLKTRQRGVVEWVEEIDSGNLRFEDLDGATQAKLEDIIKRKR